MQGHQADHLGVFGILGVHHQRDVIEEAGEILKLAERADQLLEILQPARRLGRLVVLPHLDIAGFFQKNLRHFGMWQLGGLLAPARKIIHQLA